MKKLIGITGTDGIGKSTLINHLASRLKSCHVSNIWDLLESPVQGLPFKSKKDLDGFICSLTPDSRFLFLAHALKYSIDIALAGSKKILLLDSYYYKYVATELVLGANPVLVKDVQKSFPVPDIVIELDLPLEEIIKRKNKFSRYECGLAEKANEESFLTFQKEVIKEWKNFSIKNHYRLDALKSREELVSEAINLIDKCET